MSVSDRILQVGAELSFECNRLINQFECAHVYNPLDYAWDVYADYVRKYANSQKRVLFMGMNPGPWGMAQNGVPFGEISAVQNWLKLKGTIRKPIDEHPKRPIQGWDCPRSEVSGRRFWGMLEDHFENSQSFFQHAWVVNYCPLLFLEESGRNLTPDKVKGHAIDEALAHASNHLEHVVDILDPEVVVGVGRWAQKQARKTLANFNGHIETLLHPSPASPAANRGWARQAKEQLVKMGLNEFGDK